MSPGEWVIAMLLLLCFKTKCICAVDMAVACDIHRKLDIWLRRHKETEVFIVQLLQYCDCLLHFMLLSRVICNS